MYFEYRDASAADTSDQKKKKVHDMNLKNTTYRVSQNTKKVIQRWHHGLATVDVAIKSFKIIKKKKEQSNALF